MNIIINNIKQKILKYKYKKAKPIYIVACWARWGVLPAKFSGKFDKEGNPLTIYWTDCNGTHDLYYIHKWYSETTGLTFAYFFNEKQAEGLAKHLNYLEEEKERGRRDNQKFNR